MNNRLQLNDYSLNDMGLINEMLLNNSQMNMQKNANTMPNNMSNDISNVQDSNIVGIAGSYEGYIKGNLYDDLYDQYKNYRPARLVPNNEQAELLLNVNQTTFAAHELRLYLDIYPDDTRIIELFNRYQKQASDAIMAYEKKYGPILMDLPSELNMFSWVSFDFPWEKEEM